MKKIMILIILMWSIISCSYFEAAEKERRERGRICYSNEKGEHLGCRFMK